MKSHHDHDKRSLALHRLIADKIRRDPILFGQVRATLAKWHEIVCLSSKPYLQEWERLMQEGVDACLAVAEEDSERATALRQSSPFCGVLTNQERFSFLKSWKHEHET